MNWPYPGSSMMIKRLKHIFMLSTVTLTVWMNDIQDSLIQRTSELMEETQTFLPSAANQVEVVEKMLPLLEKLEDMRFGYLLEQSGLPKTIEIKRNCLAVKGVGDSISNIQTALKFTGKILQCTTLLLAVQIAFSMLWIGMDIIKGEQRLLTTILVGLAVLINYRLHDMLNTMNYFQVTF